MKQGTEPTRVRGLAAVAARVAAKVLARVVASLAVAASAAPALAQEADTSELDRLTIEDLGKVDITSVSKRAQPISGAPSSVYVITNRDIESSGVLTLPEALRLAPNLQVARQDALSYVVTARGFNSFQTANKMLVLIDGRSVYSPLFSGVFWDAQNVMLEDLDRIEVISGPGGTLWGANAMNGVVNIISRSAAETQGGLLHAAGGDREQYASARFGGRLGANGAFRVYALGFNREDAWGGPSVDEGVDGVQGGFRADWAGDVDAFTFQGDLYGYQADAGSALSAPDGNFRGGNLVARWTRQLGAASDLRLQAYYDKVERDSAGVFSAVDTYDAEAELTTRRGRHEIVSGVGYRATHDEFTNSLNPFVTDPERRWISLAHVFVQDEMALRDDLSLVAGLKLEHSSYTGAELLPNLRLAWRPSENATLWAAVSRAVRTPSRIERDLVFPGVVVNGTFDNEELVAFEAGYRGSPLPRTTLSVSMFYNLYDDLRTSEPPPTGVLPLHVGNGMNGRTWGVEAWGAYDVTPWWRLSAGASTLHKEFDLDPDSRDTSGLQAGGNDPSYQLMLRSQMQMNDRFTVDLRLRAVDDLPDPAVPAYVEAAANLSYRLTDSVSLSVTGRNLLDDHHPETGAPAERREPMRSLYAGLRWSF